MGVSLPAGYRRTWYIEAVSGAYIDSGYTPTVAPKIETTIQIMSTADADIFGFKNKVAPSFIVDPTSKGSNWYNRWGKTGYTRLSGTADTPTDCIFGKTTVIGAKEYPDVFEDTDWSGNTQQVFVGGGRNASSDVRIFSCKLYDGETLVRDFVPSIRIADNKPGMYDTVNGVFYTNAGTDEFLYDPMVMRLPEAYRRVEYIEQNSQNAAWLDTGIIPNQTTTARIKVMNLTVTGDVILGYYFTGGDTKDWRIFNYNKKIYVDLPSTSTNNGKRIIGGANTFKAGETYELEMWNCGVKNITTGAVYTSSAVDDFTGNASIKLGRHDAEARVSHNRWYYVKISSDGQLVRDLIPCVRISDSKPGMYDAVSGEFLTSSATNDFDVGPDVTATEVSGWLMSRRRTMMRKRTSILPAAYRRVEYLESSGTQYIDSGVHPSATIRFVLDITYLEDGSDVSFVGVNSTVSGIGVSSYPQNGACLTYFRRVYMSNRYEYGGRYLIDCDYQPGHQVYSINGAVVMDKQLAAGTVPDASLRIFASCNMNAGRTPRNFSKIRLHSLSIYCDGALSGNYIPCVRISDSKPGLYDTVSGNFLTNAGTDEFIIPA